MKRLVGWEAVRDGSDACDTISLWSPVLRGGMFYGTDKGFAVKRVTVVIPDGSGCFFDIAKARRQICGVSDG